MEPELQEEEISLLDLLIIAAGEIKLLILGPLAIGLLALGVGYNSPQSFTSQAILAMPTPAQAATMLVSPIVLDPVIESLKLSKGQSTQLARVGVANQIKATVGKDGLLRLDVTANTALEAQVLANAVIDSWLKSTIPGEQDRVDLEQRLTYAKAGMALLPRLQARLNAEGPSGSGKTFTSGDAAAGLVIVADLQARYLGEVLSIQRALLGLSRDVVKQSPTLPTEPISAKKGLRAIMATLGSGFVLLLWVFMRSAWINAAQDPAVAEKQARLRSALGFKIKA
jgi:hypothetical protein